MFYDYEFIIKIKIIIKTMKEKMLISKVGVQWKCFKIHLGTTVKYEIDKAITFVSLLIHLIKLNMKTNLLYLDIQVSK